ncbi:MAG: transglutaminase domain-containing protein [Saprospiraceae bacterium]
MEFSIKNAFALTIVMAYAASGVCAQTKYAELDEQTRRLRLTKKADIPQLARILTQNCKDETEKCRAFFVWISENITYDVETLERQKARNTKGLASQEATEVLIRRTGVCEGYVSLFIELCREAGIRTIRIPGHSKSGGRVAGVGHVWLMAYADGYWRLIDPTWGSGYQDSDTKKFQKKLFENYFDADPESLIQTHYPSDPLAQMLPKPITFEAFTNGIPPERIRQKAEPDDLTGFYAWPDSVDAWLRLPPQMQALRAAERALRLNPGYGEALTRVGAWHYDQAVEQFNQMIDHSNALAAKRQKKSREQLEEDIRQINRIRQSIKTAESFFEKVNRDDYAWRNAGPYLQSLSELQKNLNRFETNIRRDYDSP